MFVSHVQMCFADVVMLLDKFIYISMKRRNKTTDFNSSQFTSKPRAEICDCVTCACMNASVNYSSVCVRQNIDC